MQLVLLVLEVKMELHIEFFETAGEQIGVKVVRGKLN
jgi:hypothetical protein